MLPNEFKWIVPDAPIFVLDDADSAKLYPARASDEPYYDGDGMLLVDVVMGDAFKADFEFELQAGLDCEDIAPRDYKYPFDGPAIVLPPALTPC